MKGPAAVLALLLAATAAAYLPALDGEPLLDDAIVLQDPLVHAPLGEGAGAWLRTPRPVTTATFALQAAVDRLDARALHGVNLVLHLAAALLAWLLARETLRRAGLRDPEGPALAAAALFALHPLQTAAVAYVAQRAEVLAAALSLAALLLLLARDRAPAARRAPLAAGALVLHALALGAKPVAATLPAAWLLHAALLPAPGEEDLPVARRLGRRLPLALALLALSALAAWHGLAAAARSTHAGYGGGLDAGAYLATQLRVVPGYLGLALWPAGQCGDWAVAPSRSWLEPGVLAGGLALAAVAAAALAAPGRVAGRPGDGPAAVRAASFGALFFLLALAPSSSVVPLLDAKAEHRVYLALLGLAIPAAAAVAVAARRLAPRRALAAGIAVAVLASGAAAAATWRRSAVWATALGFWEDAVRKSPGKARTQLNHGVALSRAGRPAEALERLERARALAADGTVSPETLFVNLVTTYLELGRAGDARGAVREELARDERSALAWSQRARVEYETGHDEACERAAALALDGTPSASGLPARELALKWMGFCRLRRGDVAGGVAVLRMAARALPDDHGLFATLGEAELIEENRAGACAALGQSAEVAPSEEARRYAHERLQQVGCVRRP